MADDWNMTTDAVDRRETGASKFKQRAAQEIKNLSDRLSAFGEKAKRALTGQGRGDHSHAGAYNNLNESLLSQEMSEEGGEGGQTVAAMANAGPELAAGAGGINPGSTAGGLVGEIPSQEELMVQTTHLAREAAELLWETIAFQAGCDEKDPQMVAQLEDLAQKAGLLNSQLRGLVRNQLEGVGSGSESVLASALEAKDMLDSCLSQYEHPSGGGGDHGGAAEATPAANANQAPQHLEAVDALEPPPLIQLGDDAPAPSGQTPTVTTPLSAAHNPFDALPPSQ
ncbi:hypothetical protein HKI87_18g87120 [Chloropicon roscoffensis]|uniref:Uncharacterized protein n=1 Tax=Chloropicon roscoffensis TaxID=1461544 RepID=A0AAX4PMF7_9CHLO